MSLPVYSHHIDQKNTTTHNAPSFHSRYVR